MKWLSSIFAVVLLSFITFDGTFADISDDECGIFVEETTILPDPSDNTTTTVKPVTRGHYAKKPKKKKSLLIIFDGTGSMSDDLVQMRNAANRIVKEMAEREDKPIKNYVLVVFNDPESAFMPTIDTEDHLKLLESLEHVKIGGGGDTPELSILGLKKGLEKAMPNSLAFIFTDAPAKDYDLLPIVMPMLQKLQVRVNVIVSSLSPSTSDLGMIVYEKIAAATEGQVFYEDRHNVDRIFQTLSLGLDPEFESHSSFISKGAGKIEKDVSVDQSFKSMSITLSGKNAKLSVKDDKKQNVKTTKEFSTKNMKFLTFPVTGSSFTFEASADSAFSVSIGGKSDLKFEVGFSTSTITDQLETAIQPLVGVKNILSVFVSDHSLIKCLTRAIMIPANPEDSFEEVEIPLERVDWKIFSSKPISLPSKMFKVKIFGYDKKGTVIERLISNGIESITGVAPEMTFEPSSFVVNEFSTLTIRCKVMSLTLLNTTIMFEGDVVNTKTSNQSIEVVTIVENFSHKNVGKYSCKAQNDFGQDSKEFKIDILTAPTVRVEPDTLTLKNGEKGSLTCHVENTRGNYEIKWIDRYGTSLDLFKNVYHFHATKYHNNRSISCQIMNGDFQILNSSLITVEYEPEFVFKSNENTMIKRKPQLGENMTLNCESTANPPATLSWFLSTDRGKNFKPFNKTQSNPDLLKFYNLDISREKEIYKCLIANTVGTKVKLMTFVFVPKAAPQIVTQKEVHAMEGSKVELRCSCMNCLPVENFSWKRKNSKKNLTSKPKRLDDFEKDEFVTTLLIPKLSKAEEDDYMCEIKNSLKTTKAKTELIMDQKPRDLKIILKGPKAIEIKKNFDITQLKDHELQCTGRAYPKAKTSWLKNGVKISDGKVLKLREDKMRENEGKYQCVVVNKFGSTSKDIWIKVKVKPVIVGKEQNLLPDANDLVRLICDASGYPTPTISWFHNSLKIENSGKYSLSPDEKQLQFKSHSSLDGTYTCNAENSFGRVSMKNQVTTKGPPKIRSPNAEVVKKVIGDSLDLECTATGYPAPKIHWSKNGKKLSDGSSLKIKSLSAEHAGDIFCHAVNSGGEARKRFEISLNEAPWIYPISDVMLKQGESKEVNCAVDGFPEPKISWTFNGREIAEGPMLLLKFSSSPGNYSCVAENSEGKDESVFSLEVLSPPRLYDGFRSPQTLEVRQGQDVELECPFDNFEEVYWEKGNILTFVGKVSNFKVKNVKEHEIYECKATNLIGESGFEFHIKVLTPPTIEGKSKVLEKVLVKPGQKMKLGCVASGYPAPSITWLQDGKILSEGRTLEIDRKMSQDGGAVSCLASNEIGNATKTFQITTFVKPFVEDGKHEVEVVRAAGDRLKLECKIEGTPEPEYFWMKNSNYLDHERSRFIDLGKMQEEKFGTYHCFGRNEIGNTEMKFEVLMKDPAEVVSIFYGNETAYDEMAWVVCEFKGAPLPHVTLSDGKDFKAFMPSLKIEDLDSDIFTDDRGNREDYMNPAILSNDLNMKFFTRTTKHDGSFIFKVLVKDRGSVEMGKVKCEVENVYGKDEFSIEEADSVRFSDGETEEVHFVVKSEQEVTLNCDIKSSNVSVVWRFNGVAIQNSSEFTLINDDQELLIKSASEYYQDGISCEVSNSISSTQRKFHLKVVEIPRWTEFTPWTNCSVECGVGFKMRTRLCSYSNGDQAPIDSCVGEDFENESCEEKPCLVDGGWSEYSEWSHCSKTCGISYKVRTRKCDNPKPEGGKDCEGEEENYEYCKMPPCRKL